VSKKKTRFIVQNPPFFTPRSCSLRIIARKCGMLVRILPLKPWSLRILSVLAAAALALALTGCGSTISSRIEKNPEAFAALPAKDQHLVKSGHIREGMDRMGVFLAWGRPPEIFMGSSSGKQTEVWQYFRTQSSFVDIAPSPYPFYPGGFYYDAGPAIVTQEIPGKHAVFVNGRVVEWAAPMRRR
jgi:hypothetical protein